MKNKKLVVLVCIVCICLICFTNGVLASGVNCPFCGNTELATVYACSGQVKYSGVSANYSCLIIDYVVHCQISAVNIYYTTITVYHAVTPYLPPCVNNSFSHTHDEYHVPCPPSYGCGIVGWDSSACNSY